MRIANDMRTGGKMWHTLENEGGNWPIESDQQRKLEELAAEEKRRGRPDLMASAVRATAQRAQQKSHGQIGYTSEDCPKRAAFFKELHKKRSSIRSA